MPDTRDKFYLTTPIYYVNARPHIGHAYSTIAADVIARRHRLLGDDTFFLTGTDEHGQKVQRSAEKAGIPPQQFADEVSATFENLWKRTGITNDDYIRTTDERHKRGVQKLWKVLEERGAIYLSSYTGQYSVGEEMFVDGPPGTIGPDGKPTETVTEENYFFRLSDYQEKLINLIESGELHVQPETTKNEVLSFLRGDFKPFIDAHKLATLSIPKPESNEADLMAPAGDDLLGAFELEGIRRSALGSPYVVGALKDLSISRTTFDWGIKVPGNDKHVVYVWLDALANYITAIGYGAEDRDDLTPAEKEAELAKYAKYWPADIHLVGKEITRFHCVYWPAFLMAAGLPTPKSVLANGWLLFEESKMSKSRGNVVRTETILDAFGEHVYAKQFPDSTKQEQDLFASDVIRYFLLREIPFGQDGSFSFDALITRYNADLANGYGNLVSRTLSMIHTYFGGLVPEAQIHSGEGSAETAVALRMKMLQITHAFEGSYDFSNNLTQVSGLVAATDAYLTAEAPWKLAKLDDSESKERLKRVLRIAAESIFLVTACLDSFMPFSTAKVWDMLGLDQTKLQTLNGIQRGLPPNTKLGPLAPIFPRADKGLAQIMTDMEAPATPAPVSSESAQAAAGLSSPAPESVQPAPSALSSPPEAPQTPAAPDTPQITIDDFVKIDLRVAQIVVAERIPKADKLLRLEVDLGYERRQILSGIAEFYTPEELLGKRIAIIANLAPRKMRGLESHGMLLAASGEDHSSKPILATFSDEIALGSKIR